MDLDLGPLARKSQEPSSTRRRIDFEPNTIDLSSKNKAVQPPFNFILPSHLQDRNKTQTLVFMLPNQLHKLFYFF